MAQDKSIDELERDVEQARARVAADIALLRAPETYEAAKNSLLDTAFGYRDRVRDQATGYSSGLVDHLKAKASANPLALAAIGAGVAWRLYRHPPVATALVGLGLASLMRTDPEDDSMHPRRLMETASEKAMELKDRAATQVTELRDNAVGALEERMHEWTGDGERRADPAASPVVTEAVVVGDDGGVQAAFVETRDPEALGVRTQAMRAPTRDLRHRADENYDDGYGREPSLLNGHRRDAYLLGAAALAVGAAIGLSRLRGADDVADDIERDDFDDGREVMWRRY